MIGKMILQGLAAAALFGAAAGLYAANAGPDEIPPAGQTGSMAPGETAGTGYLAPLRGWFGGDRDDHDDDDRHEGRLYGRRDSADDTGYRRRRGDRHDD